MAWNESTARERINKMRHDSPDTTVVVEDFRSYIAERERLAKSLGSGSGQRVWSIPRNRAVTTHAVHVYANLMDYNDRLTDEGRETEASHRRALEFLNLHYRACDALVAAFDMQRVDYHGSRLHAVALTPAGDEHEQERVAKGVAFAAAFLQMINRLTETYGTGFRTRVRIGIDSGPAVAVDSGRRNEPDPLFIGYPANRAAKLCEGEIEGIFPSAHVRQLLTRPHIMVSPLEHVALAKSLEVTGLDSELILEGRLARGRDQLEEAYREMQNLEETLAKALTEGTSVFRFHFRAPPLKTLDFAEHPPSRTVRMSLMSIFCDISGFTAYIDDAMVNGKVGEAVQNLHVMRGEMAAVLRDDFGGRKVRFIGDCLHGVLAEGNDREVDKAASVRSAVMTAAGVRSSFDLCKTLLPNIDQLGIAIGLELGITPVCRLGLRGDASVRSSSSKATCVSEEVQALCDGRQTGLGDAAFEAADARVRELFSNDVHHRISNLSYQNAERLLFGVATPSIRRRAEPVRGPEPFRAHSA